VRIFQRYSGGKRLEIPAKNNLGTPKSKYSSIEELVDARSVTDGMGSASNWELIRSWVDLCSPSSDKHLGCHCNGILATSNVPSRLIDISAGDIGQDLRLSLSPDERASIPYVTLSYTWGPNPDLDQLPLLRKNTLESFTHGISFGTLPRLFQDTIEATRRLGYRYLWIDALCIIQDDREDWQKEAAVMGQIYQCAALNIAAGGAKNSHSPLFGERDASMVRPCKVEFDWPKISSYYFRSEVRGSFFAIASDFLQENLVYTPLNSRAWVMQERTLSPRLIHFGKHQLFWRCRSVTACETFPNGIPEGSPEVFYQSTYGLDLAKFLSLGEISNWFEIVELYSTCEITRESDKLIALSGITRIFGNGAQDRDDNFLGGLWQSKLVISLLWQVSDGKKRDGSPCERSPACGFDGYVAPSWSWASVRGKVAYTPKRTATWEIYNEKYTPLVDILETHTMPTNTQNTYGQVQVCYIRLLGRLLSGHAFFWFRPWVWEPQSDHNPNVLLAFRGLFRNFMCCVLDDMNDFKPRKTFPLPIPLLLKAPTIHFLPLLKKPDQEINNYFSFDIPDLEGILITPVNGKDNEYKRVGYFKSLSGGRTYRMEKDLSSLLRDKPSELLLV